MILCVSGLLLALASIYAAASLGTERFLSYVINPQRQDLQLYYRDEHGVRFGSIQRLQAWLAARQQRLVFAMNGGMYAPGGAPKGLFIERQHTVVPLDTGSGRGNFYLKPNGVFYLTTSGQPMVCDARRFPAGAAVAWATQSGPLLLLDGAINPVFRRGSTNVAIRNGVGILPGNKIVCAISREPVNFYDFAAYFQQLGCRDALYLDGYVSRMYLPAKNWRQTDGDFGVILAVSSQ